MVKILPFIVELFTPYIINEERYRLLRINQEGLNITVKTTHLLYIKTISKEYLGYLQDFIFP